MRILFTRLIFHYSSVVKLRVLDRHLTSTKPKHLREIHRREIKLVDSANVLDVFKANTHLACGCKIQDSILLRYFLSIWPRKV